MVEQRGIRMLPPCARFIFQGGAEARAAAGRAFGLPLPEQACRSSVAHERAALWLGPEEHLLLAPARDAGAIEKAIADALAGVPHSLVDIANRQIAMAISGPDASDRLNSGCPLDLDASAFPVGMCTRTILAKAEVVLWRRGAEEYHLETGRSYSGYVLGWLREAEQ